MHLEKLSFVNNSSTLSQMWIKKITSTTFGTHGYVLMQLTVRHQDSAYNVLFQVSSQEKFSVHF